MENTLTVPESPSHVTMGTPWIHLDLSQHHLLDALVVAPGVTTLQNVIKVIQYFLFLTFVNITVF